MSNEEFLKTLTAIWALYRAENQAPAGNKEVIQWAYMNHLISAYERDHMLRHL